MSDSRALAFERFPAEAEPGKPTSVAELLFRAAHRHPQAGIRVFRSERDGDIVLTYSDLLLQAKLIAGGLQQRGHPPGTKVVLFLEEVDDFIPAFWGCVLAGHVPCALVPIRNDTERWTRHLAHVNSLLDQPLLITTGALRNEVAAMPVLELNDLRRATPQKIPYTARATDPFLIVLTSGSTGNAKGVRLTHGNVLASMAGKQGLRRLNEADVVLNWINFDHVASVLEAHMLALYTGATLLHVDAAAILTDPLLLLRLMDRYRVTTSLIPNFLLAQINGAVESAGTRPLAAKLTLDLSCVRHIITGGEANVVETGQRFLDLLAPYRLGPHVLWPGFGMTETCAGIIYSQDCPDVDVGQEFASLGFPVAGVQMRIVNEDGEMVPAGESGELQVRGDMVFGGYHNNEKETRAAFTVDGWFRTGDLGRIDAGRLSLVGRSKDCIIVSGVNYFSHELEAVLEPLDGIERSFVAAFPTRPKGAETEQLVVTFAPSFPVEDEGRLYQVIVAIRNTTVMLWGFRPSLILPLAKSAFPRTSMGKIQRSLMRKRLEAGEFAREVKHVADLTIRHLGGYVPPQTPAEAQVAGIYAEMFGIDPKALSVTASFFDLGGTSLDIIKLTRKLEQHCGMADLKMATILQNPTARALAVQVDPQASRKQRDYDPIVPLQVTGSKTPLFCIHSAIGEVLVFVNLAKYFVNERPVYALRARGLNEGEEYFKCVEEMTDVYLAAICRIQPRGPYAIAGYSFGGLVGFEIAKKLEARGEKVSFFCSIDAPPSTIEPICPDYCAISLAFFLSLIEREQMLALHERYRADDPELCEYLIQIANPKRLTELNLDLRKFTDWVRLAVSLGMMGKEYVPTGRVDSVTVLYAHPRWVTVDAWLNDQLKRWDQYVRNPPRYLQVPGEHHSLLGSEHLGAFQAILRAELSRALAET